MSTRHLLSRFVFLATLFLLLAAVPSVVARVSGAQPASAAPSFLARVEQPAGAAYTLVRVRGVGLESRATGTLAVGTIARGSRGAKRFPAYRRFRQSVVTSDAGDLTATIRLPRLAPGSYVVRLLANRTATDAEFGIRGSSVAAASAGATGAALVVSPSSGAPGDNIVVTGSGFPAGRKGSLAFAGSTRGMPGARSGADGSFRASFNVPASTPGTTSVTATIARVSASVPFTVGVTKQPTATPSPSTTPSSTATPSPTPSPTATPSATPSPSPTPTRTPTGSDRKVVTYFPIWNPNAGYSWENVDFSSVTHIGHFSVVPQSDGSIEVPDWGPFPDTALVQHAHDAGVKVYLVVGGDHAAATQGFAAMAASARTRGRFVRGLITIVDAQGYDGVEIDWEFPYNSTDRANLTALVRDVRAALGTNRSLSVAMPGSNWYGQWFDVSALEPNLDWFSVMTYSFAGASWAPTATHNSPLYGDGSIDSARQYYLGRGVPARKFLAGIPFFGERFDGAESLNQTLTDRAGGSMDYRGIAPLIGNGWTQQRDMAAGEMPYLTKDGSNGVIVYDDPQSVRAKCRYVADQGIGGVIVWRLGQDVVDGSQPLFRAVANCK